MAVQYTCRGPRVSEIYRQGCGEDLTDRILAVPTSGQATYVVCEKCGNVVKVTRYPEEGK